MKSLSSLTLRDVMSSGVLSIAPRQTLGSAARIMAQAHASCLVVLDEQRPVGILTERDIVRLFHERVALDAEVGGIMSQPVLTVAPSLDFHSAYALLQRHQVRHLVVIEASGQIAGIVSESDFRSHLEHGLLERIRNLSTVIDRGFPSLAPDDTLVHAVERMAVGKWDYLMVVENQRSMGIVTERDIPRFLAETGDPAGVRLRDVMSTPVQSIALSASVIEADARMTADGLRHLAVVDEQQRIVGVISQHRLMEYLGLEIIDKPTRQHKALHAEKKQLESRLHLVLDKTGIGIWEYDHRRDRGLWSESLCNLLGYPHAPESFADWLACIHPDDRARVAAQVSAATADGNQLFEAEYRMRKADGQWLWFYARGKVAELDEQGRALLSVGTLTDISRRRHAEILLRIQHEFAEKLALAPQREALQQAILDSALSLPELDGGGLYWRHPDGSYQVVVQRGLSAALLAHLAEEAPQLALLTGGHLQTSCCPACERCGDPTVVIGPELAAQGVSARVVMPILVGEQAIACLDLFSNHAVQIEQSIVTALDTLAHQFSQALERLLAQEQAQSREKDLQELFAAIDDYLFVLDGDGKILHCNKAVEDRLGYGKSLIGQPIAVVHPPELRDKAREVLEKSLAGKCTNCPMPLLKADGSRIVVDTRVAMGHWGGQPAIIGISRDISEQVRQQEAVLTEKRFSDDIINSLPGIFYMFGADGRFLRWNRHFATLSGYSEEQLAGMGGPDFFEGEDRTRIAQAMRAVFEQGAASAEAEFRTRNGEKIPHYFSGRRVVIDGQAYLIGLGIDISAERLAQRALSNERTRLKTLVETIPELVWLKDPEGVYLACNPLFERFFGAKESEIVGKTDYDFVPPELADFFRANDQAAMAAGKPSVNEEWITFADDGHRALLETIKTPMYESGGKLIGVLGIARDITEVRKAEDDIRRLNQSLEQRVAEEVAKNREKDLLLTQQSRLATMGEMMHNVAHQWRQPLNTLNLILQNIRDAYIYGELDRTYLDEVIETGDRVAQQMSRTIDDFRNFFRPDAASTRFNLAESVGEALRLVEASFVNNQIAVSVEGAQDVCGVGYPNEFSQVLLNVLVNAKDAIKARGTTGSIVVWVGREDGMAAVHVRDNGGGIPEEILAKVFDPYFTTKESGTGIGLYMSRMIMKHMRGGIEARNCAGGAEIVVSLPDEGADELHA